MPIRLCVHANSVVRPCKFRRASMLILLCVNANSFVRPYKWVTKTKKKICSSRAAIFNHFWAKITKSETNDRSVGLSTFVNRSHKWPRQTHAHTDGHRDLETESAQWADAVKTVFVLSLCDWQGPWVVMWPATPGWESGGGLLQPLRINTGPLALSTTHWSTGPLHNTIK